MLFSPPEIHSGFTKWSDSDSSKTQCKLYHHGFIIPSPPPSPKENLGGVLAETKTDEEAKKEKKTVKEEQAGATFVARVFDIYKSDPRGMLRNERKWLAYHMPSSNAEVHKKRTRNASNIVRRTISTTGCRTTSVGRGVGKTKTQFYSIGMANYKPKQSSKEHYMHTHSFDVANTPYELLPDFCPPTSTLDKINHPRPLRAEWKGIPLDLSNDPHVDQLHPAEVYLASQLRLPAMVYLDNKRRIFAEYHARKEAGLGFRRTDAQRCARIDVNKASRLWQAFERVGWLD
ncbi:hypothetical protein T552_03047 [Pneumocystis carinii B80]|uniref:SWIRM domain-containing protein n=1 Tax=Pneumocystis carinii (strain B80) TaxID=1408658 RepID=A0A0W4ZCK2_PNEC8|nr:hypothetical protein T552_03047 [Pneumocystis carinii B80]KTW26155.1 hypothetical protein T552_03047 [Pneumocystis carinii B80]